MITLEEFKTAIKYMQDFDKGFNELSTDYVTIDYDCPCVMAVDNMFRFIMRDLPDEAMDDIYEYMYNIDEEIITIEELYKKVTNA